MIISCIKYILCFVGAFALMAFSVIYWFGSEANDAWWVIERFGGMEIISDKSITPDGADDIYMRSLVLKPPNTLIDYLESFEPCVEFNQNCMTRNSALISLQLNKEGQVRDNMNDYFERYKTDVKFYEGGCPIIYETTMIMKEVASLNGLSAKESKKIAREKIDKIKKDGGLFYSLVTPDCQHFFRQKPYFVRGYIGHLTFLMEAAEGRFSASWRFLGAMSSIKSTLVVPVK
ncbi:hypothetical protein [Pseudomonas mandelii]|uniref:hypothetical protein n=1 Tax=Pseudomonas mandelii TaxID=75612 RepID=UPI00224B339B|nr:hypothetical protein [Pseudomonas mandelii]MCX2898531.1 hypothetical protein [Pseudomonas mandelii]